MKALSCLLVLAACVALTACGGGGGSQQSSSAAPASGAPEYGAPECDEYIKKYEACINSKVPESSRAAVKQGLDASKASFKQAASTEQGKAALATGCKQALDSAKTAMSSYGCSW